MTLHARIQALHDEHAADARGYGSSYEDDRFHQGRDSGRQDLHADIASELATALAESPPFVWVVEMDDRYYDSGSVWVHGVFADPVDAMMDVDDDYEPGRNGEWGSGEESGVIVFSRYIEASCSSEDIQCTITQTEIQ